MIEVFVVWLALAVVAGVIASNKGRSGVGFFFVSIVLSPLVGIIGALAAKSGVAMQEEEVRRAGASKDFRQCPACAEVIRREALKCRYCGDDVPALSAEISAAMPDERAKRLALAAVAVLFLVWLILLLIA